MTFDEPTPDSQPYVDAATGILMGSMASTTLPMNTQIANALATAAEQLEPQPMVPDLPTETTINQTNRR